ESSCFFFQAEDGIRGFHVTGVQTCALPILLASMRPRRCTSDGFAPKRRSASMRGGFNEAEALHLGWGSSRCPGWRDPNATASMRSEERRVGKEGGYGWLSGIENRNRLEDRR